MVKIFGLKLHTVSFQVVSCRAMNVGVVIIYTNGFLKNDFDILPCNMVIGYVKVESYWIEFWRGKQNYSTLYLGLIRLISLALYCIWMYKLLLTTSFLLQRWSVSRGRC